MLSCSWRTTVRREEEEEVLMGTAMAVALFVGCFFLWEARWAGMGHRGPGVDQRQAEGSDPQPPAVHSDYSTARTSMRSIDLKLDFVFRLAPSGCHPLGIVIPRLDVGGRIGWARWCFLFLFSPCHLNAVTVLYMCCAVMLLTADRRASRCGVMVHFSAGWSGRSGRDVLLRTDGRADRGRLRLGVWAWLSG